MGGDGGNNLTFHGHFVFARVQTSQEPNTQLHCLQNDATQSVLFHAYMFGERQTVKPGVCLAYGHAIGIFDALF